MAKQKLIKVALERTSRTDLICLSCGSFRTDWAILPVSTGLVRGEESKQSQSEYEEYEPQAGVHTQCIGRLHVRGMRKKRSE